MLLLQFNADVYLINGEGRLPRDVTQDNENGREINKLLRAAEATEIRRLEGKLLTAARDGDLDLLKRLVMDLQTIALELAINPLFFDVAQGPASAQY